MAKSPNTDANLAGISLQSRIPQFWRAQPRLWFAQFEAVVAPQHMADEQKYNLVVGVLQQDDAQQASDIILSPPEQDKYQTLKERLITVFEASAHQQTHKLLRGLDLGDQRPTQLLRKMRELAGDRFKDETLKLLFLDQLPQGVRTVLSASYQLPLTELATLADTMLEQYEPRVDAIAPSTSTAETSMKQLVEAINDIKSELTQFRRDQPRQTPQNTENRGRPAPWTQQYRRRNINFGTPKRVCYFHYRFRDQARKCEHPCSWNQKN